MDTSEITTHDAHNPVLKMCIRGSTYAVSLRAVHVESHQWIKEVLTNHLMDVDHKAYTTGRAKVQNEVKGALGL